VFARIPWANWGIIRLIPRFFIIGSSCLLVNTPSDIPCFKLRLLWVRVIETMDACCTRYLLILGSSSRPCMVPVWANSEYGVTLGSRSGMYFFTLYECVFNTCCSTSLYYIHAYTHLFAYLSLFLCIIYIYTSGWWFGTCFIFPYIGSNIPNWLIFFRGVETTNQYIYICVHNIHPCAHTSPPFREISGRLRLDQQSTGEVLAPWLIQVEHVLAPQSPVVV